MKASDEKIWQPTVVQNLVRYAPSGTYFARLRVGGETCLEKFENRDVFRRETTIARHTARTPSKIESKIEARLSYVHDKALLYLAEVLKYRCRNSFRLDHRAIESTTLSRNLKRRDFDLHRSM